MKSVVFMSDSWLFIVINTTNLAFPLAIIWMLTSDWLPTTCAGEPVPGVAVPGARLCFQNTPLSHWPLLRSKKVFSLLKKNFIASRFSICIL